MTIVGFWVDRSNHINPLHREGPWRCQVKQRNWRGVDFITVHLALMASFHGLPIMRPWP
jgi:hypothetical protein